ncbi:hypothetical protein NW762_013042 [Fusarium torreyae]|uniref:Nephrocystin 3-like N-terminal domain-containing protein n=1 Tax=Fusarium torreyae TaxID=1237075 RepID=A0A9W8RQ65_9HYPO|nr:hypothetical protein NW762_013042 [Fusarium torreyae]
MNKPRGLFWIKGNPGTGKSVLMKFAVDMMSRRKSGELVVSFFIHGRGVALQKSPLGLYRALLNSMLRSFPVYLKELTGRFKDREERYGSYERSNGWRWTDKELETFLSEVLSKGTKSQPVVIFVDALDECGADEAKRLLTYFQNIMSDVESGEALVKICFSSRHYPILGQETMSKLYVEEKNDGDIRLVIQNRLKEIQPPKKREKIETEILLKAHGGFQWAMLMIDMVHDGNTTGARTQSLLRNISTIPDGLDELYAVILSGVTKAEEQLMTKLFRWVLFTERPLSTQELREALATDQDMTCTTVEELRNHDNYSDSLLQFEIHVRHISRGLVEFHTRDVYELYELDGEDWNREAQFVHQSAADFVLERFLSLPDHGSTYKNPIGTGHYEISRSCLRYITLTEILNSGHLSRGQLSIRFPLMPYGVAFVLHHIRAVEKQEIPQTDLLALIQWDRPQRFRLLAAIWRMMDPDRVYAPVGWPFEEVSPLHVLVGFGSTSSLDVFLQKDVTQLVARDSYGNTPLLVALRENFQDLALLLLNRSIAWQAEDEDFGASVLQIGAGVEKRDYLVHVNAENDDGETPLGIAVSVRSDKAIQHLIDAGADVKNEKGLLFHAVDSRNKVLLSRLIQKGANLDGAVFFAVKSLSRIDHDDDDSLHELLSDLLEAGANTSKYVSLHQEYEDESDDDDNPYAENYSGDEEAIIVASRKGMTQLVSLLLSHGSSAAAQGEYGVFPLFAAVMNNHLETVKVLLSAAPEAVRLTAVHGDTALDVVSDNHSFDIALHLIQQGEEPDIPLRLLFIAIDENKLELVKAILHADESLMKRADETGENLFEEAVRGGRHEMAELLLGMGEVDINPLNAIGQSAFWSTLVRADIKMARLLIDTGAVDVNENWDGRTPLWWAIQEGNEDLVKLLLDTGEVDIYEKDEDGQPTFWWAFEKGVDLVIETFLASDKSVLNKKDRSGRTLISQAAFRGNAELFKRLLATVRADTEVIDYYGSTLLSLAVHGGNDSIIQLLLDRTKFDINVKDLYGRTPLWWAAFKGYKAAAKLLLNTGQADIETKDNCGQTPLSVAQGGVTDILLDYIGRNTGWME